MYALQPHVLASGQTEGWDTADLYTCMFVQTYKRQAYTTDCDTCGTAKEGRKPASPKAARQGHERCCHS